MNRTEIIPRDLESVLSKLEAALNVPKSDLTRDSAILRFELAFKVSWKAIQKFALAEGFEVNSPRQAFERAFQLGWLSDEVLWQPVLLQRNAASISTANLWPRSYTTSFGVFWMDSRSC
jgi:nucleotidyltransferase substrate binding protein (TIGR01987 family)